MRGHRLRCFLGDGCSIGSYEYGSELWGYEQGEFLYQLRNC